MFLSESIPMCPTLGDSWTDEKADMGCEQQQVPGGSAGHRCIHVNFFPASGKISGTMFNKCTSSATTPNTLNYNQLLIRASSPGARGLCQVKLALALPTPVSVTHSRSSINLSEYMNENKLQLGKTNIDLKFCHVLTLSCSVALSKL